MRDVVELSGGRQASYQVVGSGRPALMFPGGPGFGADYMQPDAELFADTLQSFLVDPHGSAMSTPPSAPEAYTPAGHAQFYEEVRQALGLESVVVLGHSFGAITALTYCALFPAAAACCISVAGGGVSPELDDAASEAARAEWEAALSRHAGAPWYPQARSTMDEWTERVLATDDPSEVEAMMAEVLPLYTAHPERPETAAALLAMGKNLSVDLAAVKAWETGIFQTFDLRPLLPKIGCPTLVAAGEVDFICGPAQARLIAAAIPESHLALIPDCGHLLSVEAPAEYRQAVLAFLNAEAATATTAS